MNEFPDVKRASIRFFPQSRSACVSLKFAIRYQLESEKYGTKIAKIAGFN